MSESQEIELILPDEEVDPREADVLQESSQDFDTSASQENNVDELEDYSDGVQKRIDKLTYRMREAERQRRHRSHGSRPSDGRREAGLPQRHQRRPRRQR